MSLPRLKKCGGPIQCGFAAPTVRPFGETRGLCLRFGGAPIFEYLDVLARKAYDLSLRRKERLVDRPQRFHLEPGRTQGLNETRVIDSFIRSCSGNGAEEAGGKERGRHSAHCALPSAALRRARFVFGISPDYESKHSAATAEVELESLRAAAVRGANKPAPLGGADGELV